MPTLALGESCLLISAQHRGNVQEQQRRESNYPRESMASAVALQHKGGLCTPSAAMLARLPLQSLLSEPDGVTPQLKSPNDFHYIEEKRQSWVHPPLADLGACAGCSHGSTEVHMTGYPIS